MADSETQAQCMARKRKQYSEQMAAALTFDKTPGRNSFEQAGEGVAKAISIMGIPVAAAFGFALCNGLPSEVNKKPKDKSQAVPTEWLGF